jgi:dihydrofolate reductase
LTLIVAMGRRREIGLKGQLLFRLRDDLAHFKAATTGKPLMMGRKTWESLPKRPLPGRPNIVLTRNADLLAPAAWVMSSISTAAAAARAMAARRGVEEAFVIGGADIYEALLPYAARLLVTDVDAEAEADAFFPVIDREHWREASSRRVEASAGNEAAFTIRDLRRV